MIRVLIIDDHAAMRASLRELLSETPDLAVTGEAATGQAALQAASEQAYDIALLDLGLPDMSGLEVLPHLCQLQPALRIVVVSSYPAEPFGGLALAAGADGYVPKECVPNELVAVMRRLMAPGRAAPSPRDAARTGGGP
jgi:two-component system, NarL family, invasion response regulator UvrY